MRAGAPAGIADPVIGAAGTGDEVGTTAELGEGAEMAALGTGGLELSPKSGPDSAGLPAGRSDAAGRWRSAAADLGTATASRVRRGRTLGSAADRRGFWAAGFPVLVSSAPVLAVPVLAPAGD